MSTTTTPRSREDRRTDPATVPSSSRVLAALASWRLWFAGVAGYAVFAGAFFASSAPFAIPTVEAACGQPPLDVRFTSTAADVHDFLEACGPAGREAYRAMEVADLLYPTVFAVVMASSLALVLTRLAPGRRWVLGLAVLPFVASAFDYLENLFAWRALAAYPGHAATSALLGQASAAKSSVSWVAGVLLLLGLGALAVRWGLGRLARRTAEPIGRVR